MKITIDLAVLERVLNAILNAVPQTMSQAEEQLDSLLAPRGALAQPQQEPVDALDNPRPVGEITWGGCVSWNGSIPEYGTDLYTYPPQRKPLTDEQLSAIGSKIFPSTWNTRHVELARAIEAAHNIKENT